MNTVLAARKMVVALLAVGGAESGAWAKPEPELKTAASKKQRATMMKGVIETLSSNWFWEPDRRPEGGFYSGKMSHFVECDISF